jgi:hypothetical protein
VVNDNTVTVSAALLIGPANALGELGLRVRQEKLIKQSVIEHTLNPFNPGRERLTMSSPSTPLALPHALIT